MKSFVEDQLAEIQIALKFLDARMEQLSVSLNNPKHKDEKLDAIAINMVLINRCLTELIENKTGLTLDEFKEDKASYYSKKYPNK